MSYEKAMGLDDSQTPTRLQQVPPEMLHPPSRPSMTPAFFLKAGITALAAWLAYKKTNGSIPWAAGAAGVAYFVVPPLALGLDAATGSTSAEGAWNRFEYHVRPRWLTEDWRLRNF